MVRNALLPTTFAVLILGICTSSYARTWYVNEGGTGDAPTIWAAMDSAAYGDTVLVGPGTYAGYIPMTDGVTLRSELGPTATELNGFVVLVDFGPGDSGRLEGFTLTGGSSQHEGVICCWEARDFLIRGNVFRGNASGITCDFSDFGEITGNTLVDNDYAAIWIRELSSDINVRNNICVGNRFGIEFLESDGSVECNDCWDNAFFDFDVGSDPEADGNFSEDPLFCDREGGDFTLDASSPCLPGNHPSGFDCGLIGAFGQGCDGPITDVAEEPHRTWSGIKALFR